MKVKIFKLGKMVNDKVSATEGMLTHAYFDMDRTVRYVYQPRGLNPETHQPVERIYLESDRIEGGEIIEVELPLEILSTQAEDIATGFNGTIINLTYHINGCVHVDIKPKGILPKTGATIDAHDFDIRRIKGEAIKPLDEKQLEKSKKDKPSPAGMPEKPFKS